MANVNFETLASLREIQGQHGPHGQGMCMASSKFLALKILGLVDCNSHLSAFLESDWAKKHRALPLVNSWGWTLNTYNEPFNRDVLPAALNEPTAGVKNLDIGKIEVRYVYFRRQIAFADELLQAGAPLVVAVGVGGSGQDHHIVVVRGTDGTIWAVDPWPGPASKAVKKLPVNFSFSRPDTVKMTLGELHIPCASQLFGYYRDADPESRHVFTVQRG